MASGKLFGDVMPWFAILYGKKYSANRNWRDSCAGNTEMLLPTLWS